ncbi:hypothetical protein Z946_3951 [Sulfitobacter noctilucicola]|uniref:PA14 domain-containing protein n=1 Tax=Sulfitobacter noctilucicola TaxID=1342301 RepID=A0A7W6M827_9RHOB|nr:PA14 domain-containing protein [Sulfitobacter noctilucicola]KIN65053.1 hypothetical protein Z946_3951 [Sulfitobacter noctilucicola]MBB4173808.1 hypothetical protein [Sulfitobacter noctilucicola]
MFIRTAVFCATVLAAPAFAQSVTLTPADPQPSADDLKPGLAVSYGYGGEMRSLDHAEQKLKRAKSGPPLRGLSYDDNTEGEKALTSTSASKVAAAISGFVKFDKAGTFEIEFISNDGIIASIGGQQVALSDGVHSCDPAGPQEVIVPQAGWYALEATYFQRKGTACLIMDWDADGRMGPAPDSAFAHVD